MFSPSQAPKAARKADPSGQVDVWELELDEDSIKYFAKNDFT
jgi:hypothetical protein